MSCKTKCINIALLALAGIVALGWVVMALWNALIPVVFAGGHRVDYLQAIGLLLLCKILFGGWRCHGGWRHRAQQHRLEQMSAEEREKFQSGLSRFCCKPRH
jgi:uncharacterized membrane protein YqjE